MSSTQFSKSASQMDAYTNVITYTVYEFTHDGLTLPSTFLSKKDAYRYVKIIQMVQVMYMSTRQSVFVLMNQVHMTKIH